MSSRDKDAELKIRTSRYLWHLGYATGMEAALSSQSLRYGKLKRFDLTDIDVVGIRFDADLTWRQVVADCKSGRESAIGRTFWLSGLMTFFQADRGYLVMKAIGAEVREPAQRLKISLLDDENLNRYEADKGIASSSFPMFAEQTYDRHDALWGLKLPKGHAPTEDEYRLQRLFGYLSYSYWFHEEYRNVMRLISVVEFASIPMAKHPAQDRMILGAYQALFLWSISILKMCGSVIATQTADIHKEIRRYIFGGEVMANERANLMKQFSKVSGESIPLEPPYYDELLELAARMISFSHFAKEVPRYIQAVIYGHVLHKPALGLASVFGSEYSLDTVKLAKDMAAFLVKTTGIEPKTFAALMSE